MNYHEVFRYIFSNLYYRKLRTALTILAIVIGIAAIVVMISLGQGIKKSIDESLQRFSPRTVFIVPGDVRIGSSATALSGKLYEKDVRALERIPEVEAVARLITSRASIEYKGTQINGVITGVDPDVFLVASPAFELEKGRFLKENDQNAVVLGYKIAKEGFDQPVELNSRIFINDKPYTVIGIFKEQPQSVGGNPNNFILLPYDEVKNKFKAFVEKDEVSFLNVVVREGYDVNEVARRMEEVLRISHKLPRDEKDFTVFSPELIQEQVNSITTIITAFLGSIAAVSILVGGINISNTMFSLVLERTREIGILKAIGAKNEDIAFMFLVESAVMSLIGGVFGLLISFFTGVILRYFSVPYYTSPELYVGALVFSFVIGIIAGYLPARRAANLSAVSALRYE